MSLALRTGERFAGDFEVVQRLSRGGMGAVYVVQQLSTGARRALKVMHAELVVDARSRERFAAEAKVSARIRSEHVVEVVAAGVEERDGEPVPWMAMELLEGADLDALVKEHGALPAAEVREIFEQIGHALSDAHDQGIIHRDLKPANIFMARSRRRGAERIVKILDFGIARIADANATSATVTSAIGSPIWMAPEQAQTGARLKPATDVWALGLIAFYLLTGRSYWLEANGPSFNLSGLLVEVMTKPMPPPSTRAAELGVADVLPPGVDGWFAQAVVRDPAGRFGDARSAVAALVSVLAEAGLAAPSDARRAEGSAPRVAATERLDSDSARPSGPSSAPGVVAPTEQLDSPAAHRSGPSSAPGVVAPTEQLDSLPPSTAAPAEPTPQRTAPTEQPERTPAPGAAFESEPRAVHPTEQLAPSPTSKLPSAAGPGGERTPAPVDHASPDPDAPISLPLTRGHLVGKALVVALILSVVVGVGVLVYAFRDVPVEIPEATLPEVELGDLDRDGVVSDEERRIITDDEGELPDEIPTVAGPALEAIPDGYTWTMAASGQNTTLRRGEETGEYSPWNLSGPAITVWDEPAPLTLRVGPAVRFSALIHRLIYFASYDNDVFLQLRRYGEVGAVPVELPGDDAWLEELDAPVLSASERGCTSWPWEDGDCRLSMDKVHVDVLASGAVRVWGPPGTLGSGCDSSASDPSRPTISAEEGPSSPAYAQCIQRLRDAFPGTDRIVIRAERSATYRDIAAALASARWAFPRVSLEVAGYAPPPPPAAGSR